MARIKKPVYSFDFETIVNPDETRVWLWGSVELQTENFKYGTTIDSFMETFSRFSCSGYFHNLKFDGQFIFYWLFHHGYTHTTERHPGSGKFSTLISEMGTFYSIKIHFREGGVLELFDSLRLIAMPVRDMPKAFGLDIKKLDMDYDSYRTEAHNPTPEEIEYVKHDCLIVARALRAMKEQGMSKMTAASNALHQFKSLLDNKEFDRLFPQITLDVDKDCRRAYKGGWTYLNPKYKDKLIGRGQVYDVNSMYPWAMRDCPLPWGEPIYYEGEYKDDPEFPLYIQCLKAEFKLNPGMYPSIQIKGSMRFVETEYLEDSKGEQVILYVTNVDLDLIKDTYDLTNVEYIGGYKFRVIKGVFKEYIEKWYAIKNECKKTGNWALYFIAKLMLNSLYGKFGSNPEKRSKYPYLDPETDIIKYEITETEVTKTAYVPVAAFITSHCRNKVIRTAIACGDQFVYADTDSVHIIGEEIPDIDIDEYRLGAFKCESVFERAKFHRAKCYIEDIDNHLHKKCAGLPKAARENFNFDTMTDGHSFEGKLVPKNIKGGVILEERIFTIK